VTFLAARFRALSCTADAERALSNESFGEEVDPRLESAPATYENASADILCCVVWFWFWLVIVAKIRGSEMLWLKLSLECGLFVFLEDGALKSDLML